MREAIAAGFTKFGHIDTKSNVADIFTKPLAGPEFRSLSGEYLFRKSQSYWREHKKNRQGPKQPDTPLSC